MQITAAELKELIGPHQSIIDMMETHDDRIEALTMAVRQVAERIGPHPVPKLNLSVCLTEIDECMAKFNAVLMQVNSRLTGIEKQIGTLKVKGKKR